MLRRYCFVIAGVVLFLDRLAKWLVATNIPEHDSRVVILGIFSITHTQNPGAAFDLWSSFPSRWKLTLLIVFTLVAVSVLVFLLWKNKDATTTISAGLALILGGTLGNLWDRLSTGSVVDFLDFSVAGYHWPAFNLADSAIVVGALLLVGEIIFSKAPEPAEEEMVSDR